MPGRVACLELPQLRLYDISGRGDKRLCAGSFSTDDGETSQEYLTYRSYAPVKEGSISWEKFFNHIIYTVSENKDSFLKQGIFVDDIKSLVDNALQIWLERIT